MWIDTHCHLDAAEFDADRDAVRAHARAQGVSLCVIPAVARAHWAGVAQLAQRHADAYALGIHPLYVPQAQEDDVQALDEALTEARGDPRLVAVGEIGLDAFVPQLRNGDAWEHQVALYRAQLKVAKRAGLPVILHVRRSADALLALLVKVLGGDTDPPVAGLSESDVATLRAIQANPAALDLVRYAVAACQE